MLNSHLKLKKNEQTIPKNSRHSANTWENAFYTLSSFKTFINPSVTTFPPRDVSNCMFFPLPSQVLVVQPTSPSVQIKEPPPSPGSPSAENMYAAPGPLYVQVRPRPHTRNNNKKHTRAYRKDSPINHFSNRRRCDYFACFCPSLRRANNANDLRAPNNSRIGGHHKACCRSNLTPTIEI